MVIGTHIKLDGIIEGEPDIARTFAACIVGDGVAIFWLILGFFFFRSCEYFKRVCGLVKKVLIPIFVFSILMFFFYNWIAGGCGFVESLNHSAQEYIYLLYYGLLRWQNVIPGCDHLWYLYVYVIVILLYPALKGVYEYIDANESEDLYKKRKQYIIAIAIITAVLLINDITINGLFEFSHHAFAAALAASIYVLSGAFLYKNINNIRGNVKFGILGLSGWFFINLIRTIVQYFMYSREEVTEEPLFWFTCYAFISVICLVLFVFGCFSWIQRKDRLSIIVNRIGNTTFYIYLIHVIINAILANRYDLKNKILNFTGYSGIKVLLYEIIYTLIIFLVSLIISLVILLIKDILRNGNAINKKRGVRVC